MKRVLALAITVCILGVLFWKADQPRLFENLKHTNWLWFAAAIAAFIPQIGTIAWRWKRLVSVFAPIGLAESVKLILASQTMNLVLPSKMGDLSKGYFLSRRGTLNLPRAMNVVIFEKLLDVATLAAFMLAGVAVLLLRGNETSLQFRAAMLAGCAGGAALAVVAVLYFVPPAYVPGLGQLLAFLEAKPRLRKVHALFSTSHDVITLLQSRGGRRGEILLLSVTIWVMHLGQIYCFFRCLDAQPSLGQFCTLVPLAIFIGLLPISIAGFGTRDAALIVLFPQYPREVMLGVALYVNLRYLLPAAAGASFLHKYLQLSKPTATETSPAGS